MAVIETEEDGIATDKLNSVDFDIIAYAGRVKSPLPRVFGYTSGTLTVSPKMS